jgi:hypothetical protein
MLWQEWSQLGLNAMGKLVADIIVETLQNAGAALAELYRGRGRADIAQFAGAIGSAHSPLLYLRRRHACGFAVDRRLVSANAPSDVRQSASHR